MKISVKHPDQPDGELFNVGGIAAVPNGGSVEVDDDLAKAYLDTKGKGARKNNIVTFSSSSSK